MRMHRLEVVDDKGVRNPYDGSYGTVMFEKGVSIDVVDCDQRSVWRIIRQEDGGGGIMGPNVRILPDVDPVGTDESEGDKGPGDPPPAPPPANVTKPDRMAAARAARAAKRSKRDGSG